MSKVMLVLDDPGNCLNCPCISGYGRRCMAMDKAFDENEYKGTMRAYPEPYKPYWCPLEEAEG